MSKIDKAQEEATRVIDELGDPDGEYKMTKREWVDFLGGLISDLQIRKEATEQELEGEDDEEPVEEPDEP